MFRAKKRGLRSLRSVFLIVVVIFLIPLIVAVLVNNYFSPNPIYPKYDEVIEISKSSENGYIYFTSAEVIANRIYSNFIDASYVMYKPLSADKGRFLFDFDDARLKSPSHNYPHFTSLLKMNRDYIRVGLFAKAFSSGLTPKKNELAMPKQLQNNPDNSVSDNRNPSIIWVDWKSEILKSSEEVLSNIKKANESKYFIKYPFDKKQSSPVDVKICKALISVALVNCLVNVEMGNYTKAMEWLEEITHLALRCYENSIASESVIEVVKTVYAYLLLSPCLPKWFYSDLVCSLIETKEKLFTFPFYRRFELILLEMEYGFREEGNDNRRMSRIEQIFNSFANYRVVSKQLEEKGDLFLKASWDEVERSVLRGEGRVWNFLINTRDAIFSYYPHSIWSFSSGDYISRTVMNRNLSLVMIYTAILLALCKQYELLNGRFPNNIEETLRGVISDEEISWFLKHSSAVNESNKLIIRIYPLKLSEASKYLNYRLFKGYMGYLYSYFDNLEIELE
ncbi:MAG: hypothetical protein N3G21_13035 [Candidatus Hydrogenedentes bacterium]|nr:hypothetical protein [Candidatus Hydrogenedentota bacterium]